MNTYNFDVNFTTGRIYGPDLLLVVNDHNSTTFKFTFDQEGRYVFKLLYPDNTIYVQDIIDGELVLTKGVLNQEGNYKFEISLYGDDNRLTTARIKEFPVRLELVETDEPVQADDRLPILDNLIEETNKVVEAAKNGEFDGATFTPSVSDNGDLSWTNDKGKENPPTVNIAGPPGAPGAVKMQVVDTLPDVGNTDTIYLLKKDTPDEQNLYDEYVYTEASGWEHIGDTSVDLTDYYTKEETEEKLNSKQDALTAGNNITIEDNVISAKDGVLPLVVLPARAISDVAMNDQEGRQINILSLVKDQIEYAIDNFNGCCLLLFGGDDSSTNWAYTPYTYLLRPSFMYHKKQTVYTWIMYYASASTPVTSNELYGNKRITINAQGTWNNDKFTCTSCYYKRNSEWSYLYIKNTKPYTPTSDYNPATKKYVDDNKYTLPVASAETLGGIKLGEGLSVDENGVVSASGCDIPIYNFKMTSEYRKATSTVTYAYMSSDDKIALQNIIQNAYDKGLETFALFVNQRVGTYTGTNEMHQDYLLTIVNSKLIKNKPSSLLLAGYSQGNSTLTDVYLSKLNISLPLSWNEDSCTVGVARYINVELRPLSSDNTIMYVPTEDYNPATKKYVDDGLGTKIGENQFVFAKTFNGNDNANYSRLFHQSGCTDSDVCGYFSDILTKMYTNAQGTYYNQISGILLLTLPNINNGFCGVFEYCSTTRKFYSVNTAYNRSIVYEIEWTGSIDDDKKEITVSKVKINSDYIKTDAPTANQHVANKQYVDDLPKSYTGYDATKTQVLKNVNGTLTWITEE